MGASYHTVNGHRFEYKCDLIEVTSISRPDTGWIFVDYHGHIHTWYQEWDKCEACEAGFRLVPDGIHYDDVHDGLTWGVCRKLTPFRAQSYNPSAKYITPTLIWVKDGEEYWEDDDEPHAVGHLECKQCGDHVKPGYCADSTKQFIKGLEHWRIDGETVSKPEFMRRLEEEQGLWQRK